MYEEPLKYALKAVSVIKIDAAAVVPTNSEELVEQTLVFSD